MKIKGLLWGMMACAALSACSSDDVVENSVENGGGLKSYVAKININMGSDVAKSRAVFDDGTEDEYKVSETIVAFYDAQKNYAGQATISGDFTKKDPANDNITSTNTVVFESASKPIYAIALINPSEAMKGLLAAGETISSLEEASEEKPNTNSGKFFMTNSTYVDGGAVQKEVALDDNVVEVEDIEELEGEDGADIYVERVVAKVTMGLDLTKKEGSKDGNEQVGTTGVYKLKYSTGEDAPFGIKIVGWKLNGTNKSFYPLKKLSTTYTLASDDWNSAEDHRSYWAEDPNYTDGTYPETNTWNASTAATDLSSMDLNYFKMTEIEAATDFRAPQYCYENTYAGTDASTNYTAYTHVALKAQYCDINGENATPLDANAYVYRINQTVWKGDALKAEIANYFVGSGKYTVKVGETVITSANINNLISAITLTAKGTTFGTNDIAQIGGFTVTQNETNVTDLVKEFVGNDTPIVMYKGGICYYTIPIKHFGGTDATKTGYWGVVRNHWYQLTVTSIAGFGDASPEPEPIIPDPTPLKTWAVKCNINILAWNKVEQGSIIIGSGNEWK